MVGYDILGSVASDLHGEMSVRWWLELCLGLQVRG